jgi:hypothetical protein
MAVVHRRINTLRIKQFWPRTGGSQHGRKLGPPQALRRQTSIESRNQGAAPLNQARSARCGISRRMPNRAPHGRPETRDAGVRWCGGRRTSCISSPAPHYHAPLKMGDRTISDAGLQRSTALTTPVFLRCAPSGADAGRQAYQGRTPVAAIEVERSGARLHTPRWGHHSGVVMNDRWADAESGSANQFNKLCCCSNPPGTDIRQEKTAVTWVELELSRQRGSLQPPPALACVFTTTAQCVSIGHLVPAITPDHNRATSQRHVCQTVVRPQLSRSLRQSTGPLQASDVQM